MKIVHIVGTGIQLLGFTNHSSYDIYLDGAIQSSINADLENNILATFQNLNDTIHTASLVAEIPTNQGPPESAIFFDKALIISAVDIPSK